MSERSPYIAWLIAGVAACLIWIASNEYTRVKKSVLETQSKVNELTEETKLTLQVIRETIEDLRKKLFRLETEYGKLEAQLSKQEAKAPKKIQRIVMHSIDNCGPCNIWKSQHRPNWESAGFTVEIINEQSVTGTRSFPWFEIFDGDRPLRVIEGVLPWKTYQELRK